MSEKKSKYSKIEKNIFFALALLWIVISIIANSLDLERFIHVDTTEGFIAEKVEMTHIQRRNEWVLMPDKSKNVTPRFLCYYFKDNFCKNVHNYQYASNIHYLKVDGGPNYVKGKIGGDFNAIMLKATIYTRDNQVFTYQMTNDELQKEILVIQNHTLNMRLIFLAVGLVLLYFPIAIFLTSRNRQKS